MRPKSIWCQGRSSNARGGAEGQPLDQTVAQKGRARIKGLNLAQGMPHRAKGEGDGIREASHLARATVILPRQDIRATRPRGTVVEGAQDALPEAKAHAVRAITRFLTAMDRRSGAPGRFRGRGRGFYSRAG